MSNGLRYLEIGFNVVCIVYVKVVFQNQSHPDPDSSCEDTVCVCVTPLIDEILE